MKRRLENHVDIIPGRAGGCDAVTSGMVKSPQLKLAEKEPRNWRREEKERKRGLLGGDREKLRRGLRV